MHAKALLQAASSNGRVLLACTFVLFGMVLGTLSFAGAGLEHNKHKGPLAAGHPAAAPPGWSIFPTLDTTNQILLDVKCASASDCWAVGLFYTTEEFTQNLTEHWNGSSWQIVPSPNTSATQNNRLESVSCISGSDCWAVGYNFYVSSGEHYETLIEHWNGSAWSIAAPPLDKYQLNGITCNSSSDCWAVGTGRPGASTPTIIEHWNGSTWSIVNSPNVSASQLESVACASASDCWAVGNSVNGDGYAQTLVEHWDGSSWSVINSPNTSATQDNLLHGVTCASASQCWAVGSYKSGFIVHQTLIEQWDGAAWSMVSAPNANAEYNALNDVTCTSASDCWAVGSYDSVPYRGQRLFEHWNGSSWSIVSSITAIPVSYLNAVTCVAASQCWAVGSSYPGEVVVENWNGTKWSRMDTPTIQNGGGYDTFYNSIDCPSANDCWAIGGDTGSHWDGVAWSLFNFPRNSPPPIYFYLFDVACTSTSSCWAVGEYETEFDANGLNAVTQTLIYHWDGTLWSIVPSPNADTMRNNSLRAIACPSATECWAVGGYQSATGYKTLLEHWDGNAWSIAPSLMPPPPATQAAAFNDITCVSASQCWALLDTLTQNANRAFIEFWNGTSWSIVNSPNVTFLRSLTCNSASDCWAVGSHYDPPDYYHQTAAVHWNGTQWSLVPTPNTSTTRDNFFREIACASPSNCWAIGGYFDHYVVSTPIYLNLIEHWDGTSWSMTAAPNVNNNENRLQDIKCTSGLHCWAVGSYLNDRGNDHTLAIQYIAPPPNITSVSRPGGGHFFINGQTVPEVSVTIQASTDLISFTTIGTATSDSSGVFQFEDIDAGNFPRRFYRALFP